MTLRCKLIDHSFSFSFTFIHVHFVLDIHVYFVLDKELSMPSVDIFPLPLQSISSYRILGVESLANVGGCSSLVVEMG